jgi:simple sugar transport system ATP-binding protein
MSNAAAVVEIKKLSKSFPGVKALSEVDFTLNRGEIHGLMGENGAGKSTLIKVLTGLYKKDDGEILLDGQPFELSSPEEAPKHGISTVYQEINLIPALSVAENIHIGRQPTKFGMIDWKAINQRAEEAIKQLDLDINVTRPVASYSVAIQQLIAIIRALEISAKILILDEPTSSLDVTEAKHLFAVLRKLKKKGIAILFVTHFIDQVYEITDRITVLRNGRLVGQYRTDTLPRIDLIANMLGRELTEQTERHKEHDQTEFGSDKEVFFQVKGLERKGSISAFDLEFRKGEVLGLAGLLGSGRTEVARLLFGIDRPTAGKTLLNNKETSISSPKKAINNYFAFCPEDRKSQGVIAGLTVRENIILAFQAREGIFKRLSRKRQNEIVDKYINALDIKTPSPEQTVSNLSGGNQQKVILARWLATNPRFLILDEPTRGIDVGARAEIRKMIEEFARTGISVLLISSELEEEVLCCSRIAVLRDRKKLSEVMGDRIDEKAIMQIIASEDIQ